MDNRGFTLVEVLVAALILFATLGAMTELLRSTLLSSSAAESALALSRAASELQPQITFAIKQGTKAHALEGGEGIHGALRYRWQAERLREAQRFNPIDEAFVVAAAPPIVLWLVTLEVGDGKRQRQFTFKALSWQ